MSETEPTSDPSDASSAHAEETQPARRARSPRKRKAAAPDPAIGELATSESGIVSAAAGVAEGDSHPREQSLDSEAAEVSETAQEPAPVLAAELEPVADAEEVAAVAVGDTADEGGTVAAQTIDEAESSEDASDDPSAEPELPVIPDHEIDRAVEALLFASSEPLTPQRVAAVLNVTQRRVKTAIDRLREEYAANQRAFDIREIAGGLRLYTRSDYDDIVARLEKVKPPEKLSASALESLAIIAYRQPITRAEIDSIRGVQSGALLKSLTDRKLIRVVGRSEQPGRPLQYGTTKRFLDHFGLASIEDLPRVEDLKAP